MEMVNFASLQLCVVLKSENQVDRSLLWLPKDKRLFCFWPVIRTSAAFLYKGTAQECNAYVSSGNICMSLPLLVITSVAQSSWPVAAIVSSTAVYKVTWRNLVWTFCFTSFPKTPVCTFCFEDVVRHVWSHHDTQASPSGVDTFRQQPEKTPN